MIETKNINWRYQVLRKIYDLAAGRTTELVIVDTLVEELGANYKDVNEVLIYWESKGLLKGIEHAVQLTDRGLDEIEQTKMHPEQGTQNFPPHIVNHYNAQGNITITGSVTQKGDGNIIGHHNQVNVTKNVTAKQGVTLSDLILLLTQMQEQIRASELAADDRETVEANLKAVEKESNKEKPRLPVIESSLKSIESVVKSTESVGSTAAKLLPLVHQAAEFARQLFP